MLCQSTKIMVHIMQGITGQYYRKSKKLQQVLQDVRNSFIMCSAVCLKTDGISPTGIYF